MKFLSCFNNHHGLVWLGLFVAALLVSGPLQGKDEKHTHSIVGKVTVIDIVGRVIEVNGSRYTLAMQTKIRDQSKQAASIADLKVGQYIQFEVRGGSAKNIRILDEGQDWIPLFILSE